MSDPVHTFLERIATDLHIFFTTIARDEFRSPAKYPDSPLTFDFIGFDETHPTQPHAFKSTYDTARRTVRLWNDNILPAYDLVEPHLKSFGEDGKKFGQWMRNSRSLRNRAFMNLEEYGLTLGRVDESTLRQLHYHKQPSGRYAVPPMANPRLPVEIRDLLRLEQMAVKSGGQLHWRTVALFDTSRQIYWQSLIPQTPPTSLEAAVSTQTPRLVTPQSKLGALFRHLSIAVPICFLVYQLSQTDHQFEVAKNFVQDMAISSLIPSFSAAMVYEGAKYIFNA